MQIPESSVHEAEAILDALSPEQVCGMKRAGAGVLQYVVDMRGTVEGLMEGLRNVNRHRALPRHDAAAGSTE